MPQKQQGSKRVVGKGGSGTTPRARARVSERLSTHTPPQRQQPRFTFNATNSKAVGPPSDSNESESDDIDGFGDNVQRATRTRRGSAAASLTGLQFPETTPGVKIAGNRALLEERSDEGVDAGVRASNEEKQEVAETSGSGPAGGSRGANATNAGGNGTSVLESKDTDAAQGVIATATHGANGTSRVALQTGGDDNNTAATAASPTSQARFDSLSLPVTPTKVTRQRSVGNKRDREDSDEEAEASPYKEMKRLRMSTPVVDGARKDGLQRPLESSSTSPTTTAKEDVSSADVEERPGAAAPSSDLRDEVEGQSDGATTVWSLDTPLIQQASGSAFANNPDAIGSPADADDDAVERATMSLIQAQVWKAVLKSSQGIPLTQDDLPLLRCHASYLQAVTLDLTGTVLPAETVLPPSSSSTSFAPFPGFIHSSTGAFRESAQTGLNGPPLAPGQGLPEGYDSAPNSENAKVWKEIAKTPTFSVA